MLGNMFRIPGAMYVHDPVVARTAKSKAQESHSRNPPAVEQDCGREQMRKNTSVTTGSGLAEGRVQEE